MKVTGFLLCNSETEDRALIVAEAEVEGSETAARNRFSQYFGVEADLSWDQQYEADYTLLTASVDNLSPSSDGRESEDE